MSLSPAVLLVEDDRSQAALIQRWLGGLAHVTHCVDGHAGLAATRQRPFDVLLSDIRMPGLTGLQLVEQVRRTHRDLPVLLMTGDDDVGLAVAAIEQGVAGYLLKPLDRDRVQASVARAVASRPRVPRRTVLAVGAHPDDVEIGVGGALLDHATRGDRVVVLTLSSGASGGDPHARRRESEEAARRLGAELRMADLVDTRMAVDPVTIDAIGRVIREVTPDVVYTHSAHDNHQDHRAVHHATLVAARGVPNLFCYQSPSSSVAFAPSTFVEVGRWLDAKLDVLAAYATQTQTRAYLDDEHIRATAAYWGRFAGYGRVEPLEVVRASRST